MTVMIETVNVDEREYQSSINSIFKLTGEVVLLKPGTLPKDGLVIEDKRTYDS